MSDPTAGAYPQAAPPRHTLPRLARAACAPAIRHAHARWRRLRAILRGFAREAARLNRAGLAPALLRTLPRRERTRLVKAALLARYHSPHRCC